ncbi:glutaminase [Carboxylicivirga sediminis]|uniref:Glutaminase n=1 Tax=Carboxylicivirga sediminis TaxID=2006564 RepID=A0A941IZX2_9BACT|nr:glutaminase [Carboxylicivirga sediminis]MBR8538200.1 glutaminase [Carboxylicivirga sediminis]
MSSSEAMTTDWQSVIEEIAEEIKPLLDEGKVADYIPELGNVDKANFGMSISLIDGREFYCGQALKSFSIQSISKVFSLTKAFSFLKDDLWKRVGKEPSGNPFNSLIQLEHENGKPRNPFINAGAIVVADCVVSHTQDSLNEIIGYIRGLADNKNIQIDHAMFRSEKAFGHRNAALAHFMKSYGNIESDVDEVLDFYFGHCSLSMSCQDISRAFLFLANHGVHPRTNKRYLTASQAKRLNALLLTCGTYDAAGDFAFRVGMPGKSGVGGGIAAIIPGLLSVCVWSPGLDKHGNSLAGVKALELLTTKTGISIF